MPYTGIDGQCDHIEIGADPSDYGLFHEFDEDDFAAAADHVRRHDILTRTPVSTVGWT